MSFLQVPAWAAVKPEWRAESLGWFLGGQLVGAGLVLHRPIPGLERRSLAYLAEGPVIDWTGDLGPWLHPLAGYLKSQGAFAIRLGPPVPTHTWSAEDVKKGLADRAVLRLSDLPSTTDEQVGLSVCRQLVDAGWRLQSPEDGFGTGHPQYKFELLLRSSDGLALTETELLGGMNQQWRRNVKKATAAGVEVTAGDDPDAFHRLYVETAKRDHFTPRPRSYFQTMFTAMNAEHPHRAKLYLAHHERDLIAGAVLITVGGRSWYAYGASSTAKREVRGSNAVQWAMIRDALATGCEVYDLRGITPTLDVDDPHAGLIRFKVGTGGRAVRYVGEWDLPLRPLTYRAFSLYMKRRESTRRTGR